MAPRVSTPKNEYQCSIETNQTGKYCVRVRARFGPQKWTLGVYFLATSFPRAMKKLEGTLQFLQQEEERLRFWSVERSDDPKLAGELLGDSGLSLDSRKDFPRKFARMEAVASRSIAAFHIAGIRRELSETCSTQRLVAASD